MPTVKLGPLIKETTSITGAGDYTVAAVATFRRFSDEFTIGVDQFYYYCKQGSAWEWGIGQLSGASTIVRVTIKRSSNSNAAVSWSGGVKDIVCDFPPTSLLLADNNLSDVQSLATTLANLGVVPASQSGGTDGKVVRPSSADNWVDAAQSDTVAQLSLLFFKAGSVYYPPGRIITGLSGLSFGADYYLSTAGAITTTPPTEGPSVRKVWVGKALSTTRLFFQPQEPALDGSLLNVPYIPLPSRVTADIGYTSATLANVTGLTINVAAGETREFTARLHLSASGTGGYKASIAGTATATAIVFHGEVMAETATAFKATGRGTALGAPILAVASAVEDAYLEINGTITVNGAGTLTVQFSQNTTNGTTTVKRGSTFVAQVIP